MPTFFVPGIPRPCGSKRAIHNKKTNRTFVIPASKYTKVWRDSVMSFALEKLHGSKPILGPITLSIIFVMPRPKKHYYATGKRAGELREDAPKYHTGTPDLTKLIRSTEDALTQCGLCWRDDSQVSETLAMAKLYGTSPGATITFEAILADEAGRRGE